MPKHKFTVEEARAGGKLHAKTAFKLEAMRSKYAIKLREQETWYVLASNPAVIGTALYLTVGLLNKGGKVPQNASWIQKLYGQGLLGLLGVDTGIGVNQLGIDALQVALLAYIASGGNLAGTLQGGANVLSKILPAAAAVVK